MKQTMKKFLSFFLALTLMISVLPATAFAAEGDTEEVVPAWSEVADTSWYDAGKTEFEIDSAEKLAGVAALVNGTSTDAEGNVVKDTFEGDTILLTSNIDLTGKEWSPIGEKNSFNGIFDGNGYSILGLTVKGNSSNQAYMGMFGKTNGATLRDFAIESGSVADGFVTAGVVAQANATTIKNVSNGATVSSGVNNGYIGGIVGQLDTASAIYNCANSGELTANGNVSIGGIIGETATVSMENLYNAGNITSSSTYSATAGIVAAFSWQASGRILKNCYNIGTISTNSTSLSGIAGNYSSITMENCFFLKDAGALYANCYKKSDHVDADKTSEELKAEDVILALGEAFVADSENSNNGYPILKWQKEEFVRGYLSDIVIVDPISNEAYLTGFEHNKFEYTIEIPANEGMQYASLDIGGKFRTDAPEDCKAILEYTWYMYGYVENEEIDITGPISRGHKQSVGGAICTDGTNTPNTYKIKVGVDDEIQTYTIHVLRTPVIKSTDIADKDGVSLKVEKQEEKDIYMVPADTKEIGITVDATDAVLTINGQDAVNDEAIKIAPSYDVDGYAEVTVVAAYDDRTETKTYTLYQDTEMASVYEEAAASKAEAEAAKKEAELAKAEAEAAKKAAEEAAKAAKEAKEAVEKNNTAEAEKAAAKAEAEAAKKAEEAAKKEAEAAKKAEAAAKAETEAAKKEAETAKSELEKTKFNHSSVKLTSVKAGKKKVTLKWKKVSDADGYVIYRSTKKNKGFKKVKTIKNVSTIKWVNTKLKANKKYYYKVRAYKVVDGKRIYTKYSAVKQVKTKK